MENRYLRPAKEAKPELKVVMLTRTESRERPAFVLGACRQQSLISQLIGLNNKRVECT